MFIDCSYEGDLMAKAGASYTVGREANSLYGESYNGVQLQGGHQFNVAVDPYITPGDPTSGLIWGVSNHTLEANGTGDNKVQAYNYRVCLTNDANNRIAITEPDNYDPSRYELLLRLKAISPWSSMTDVFIWSNMPHSKTDINNSGGFSTDMIGMNWEYPDADYDKREEIRKAHEDYTKGLFYFIGHDPRIPVNIRTQMLNWGYPADEYIDNGHWSPQMYVREARRMIGELVMTQKHCTGVQVVNDAVGWAAYVMDSHNCDRLVVNGIVKNEGNVEAGGFPPYPISYRAIVPKKQEVNNLLVPVCLSASHIAYGSIRMEPVFMVLAQSAAVAATLAIDQNKAIQDIDVAELQEIKRTDPLADGSPAEIIIDNNDPDHVTVTGTWYTSNNRNLSYGLNFFYEDSKGATPKTVRYTPDIQIDGDYEIYAYYPKVALATTYTVFTVFDGRESLERRVHKGEASAAGQSGGDWVKIGTYHLNKDENSYVEISNRDADGEVVADAILFLPVTIPLTVTASAKNSIILPGEQASVNFTFTGVAPWNLTYKVGNQTQIINNNRENPLLVNVNVPANEAVSIIPLAVTNASGTNGTVSGSATIAYVDKKISSSFDTYVHQANVNSTYMAGQVLEIKTSLDNYDRETFISFPLTELTGNEG
jgi:hypothetical protein